LHWIKNKYFLLMFLLIGCQLDTHDNAYDNPFDLDGNKEQNIFPPALILHPKDINASVQEIVPMSVYAIEVNNLSGAHAVIKYNSTKLNVMDVKPGEFFKSAQAPLFLYDDNEGVLNIFTSYLGLERKVSGSGSLAIITFQLKASGESIIRFDDNESELLDEDDIPIAIKGFGQGSINAK
jgi:hypothetical protein